VINCREREPGGEKGHPPQAGERCLRNLTMLRSGREVFRMLALYGGGFVRGESAAYRGGGEKEKRIVSYGR